MSVVDLSKLIAGFEPSDYRLDSEVMKILPELRAKYFQQMLSNPANNQLWPSLFAAPECGPYQLLFDGGQVQFRTERPKTGEQDHLAKHLHNFVPWKKGPFAFNDLKIDAEWRSDFKWHRLLSRLPDLKDKVIADLGANNGYFMYRMLEHHPKLVIGFEPSAKPWANFWFMQQLAPQPSLFMEPLGVDELKYYRHKFDVIFCMGLIYHHSDPLGMLNTVYQALKPGGDLILETQAIPGNESVALSPRSKYAAASRVYFVPTRLCAENWLMRAQFRNVSTFYDEPLTIDEQRTTEWAPIRSLKDFLDPDDPSKTIESYPAPRRVYINAKK